MERLMTHLHPFDLRRALGLSLLSLTFSCRPALMPNSPPPRPRLLPGASPSTRSPPPAIWWRPANPLAAQAGREILAAGGSAVDAAVAVQLVLNLVEPQNSGIGGGAFLVHWDRPNVVTLDGRETAPAAAKPERFLGADGKPMPFYEAVVGGRSVGFPAHSASSRRRTSAGASCLGRR